MLYNPLRSKVANYVSLKHENIFYRHASRGKIYWKERALTNDETHHQSVVEPFG
jgi:hypothetical protein